MSDTHDERGGDETPVCSTPCDPDCDAVCHEDHTAGHKKQHWPYDCPAAERYDWGGSDFIVAAVKRLRAERDAAIARAESATVLPERWRALIAERDVAEAERNELREYVAALNEAQISLQSSSFEVGWWKGFKAMPTAGVHTQVLLDTVEYADELRALNVAAAVAPDAAQDGRSATLRAEDGVQASGSELEFEGRSAELSECCRATKLNDGIRHRCDSDSSGPHTHECGDCAHRWSDDTTEDDRG